MPEGEVPNVEQAVPLIVPAAVIVPVVGAGLTPGEAISVAPSEGVVGIVPIWAKAGLNPEMDRTNATITACFIGTFQTRLA